MEHGVNNGGPYGGEAPDVADVVQCIDLVVRLVGKRVHVERRKGRRLVVGRGLRHGGGRCKLR